MAKGRGHYVRPLAPGTYKQGRTDQGVDFVTHKGNAIRAMGDAVIDFVGPYQGFGPTYIAYHLTKGPHAGEEIYIGHSQAVVKVGQHVVAGATVARAAGYDTSTNGKPQVDVEIGFAQRGGTYLPSAQTHGGYTEGQQTSEGQRFLSFLGAVQTGKSSAPPMDAQASAASAGAQQQQDAAVASTIPAIPDQGMPTGGPPAPETSAPDILAPGSTDAGFSPQQAAETWQMLSSQPLASPETQQFAQRAAAAVGQ
jgi:hypothetical protein